MAGLVLKIYPADLFDIYWENPPKEHIEILKLQ